MKKNVSSNIIKGLVLPLCFTTSTIISTNSSILTKQNIIYAQVQESDGFNITKPYLENDSLTFGISGDDKSDSFYNRYWSKIDKMLIDGKDFGFNNKSTASKYYQLYNGIVTANAAEITEHFKKYQKHKIEVIFTDGSKKSYEDEGYTESNPLESENEVNTKSKFEILKVSKEKNWKGEEYFCLELKDNSLYDEFKEKISKFIINGTEITSEQLQSAETSKYFGFRIFDTHVAGLLSETNNVQITLTDGEVLNFPESSNDTPSKETSENNNNNNAVEDEKSENSSYNDKELVTNIEKNSYGEEILFTLDNKYSAKEVLDNTKEIILNGRSFDVNNFKVHWSGKISSIGADEGLEVFKTWKPEGKNTVVFKDKNNLLSKEYSSGEDEKNLTISDKLEDGEYTLGFNALYADGREGSSMLEGFFDKNVKLTVKEGKMILSMLNTLFAYSLYDFGIENNGSWTSSRKEFYGEKNSAGQYDKAIFTLPIENLDQEHLAGVIVGHMGGLQSQIGDFDKYTKVKLKFKPEVVKGWSGFDMIEKEKVAKENSDNLLQKKLIANGVDTNNDGVVTAEELQKFNGEINIGALEIDGAIDKGEIYNLDLLKNMGPGVTAFSSGSNSLGELPEDLFKNAVNIEKINLGGNKITKLPEKIFENNSKLKTINLSANNLGTLPEKIFKNNTSLETIQLDQAWLSEIPHNIFKWNTNLKSLSLAENKLAHIDDDIFTNNKEIEFLDFRSNELSSLPTSISNLAKLKGLHAPNNKLSSLPQGMENLQNLATLNLNHNRISNLAENIWSNLAKNNGALYLVDNNLSEIPVNSIINNGQLRLLDIANNNLPVSLPFDAETIKKLGLRPETTQSYYPQKTAVELNVEAKNGKIMISPKDEKLTILNMLHWYRGRSTYFGGEGIIQGIEKYKEFLDRIKLPMAELLKSDDYSRNWSIVTKVERIRGTDVVEISNNSVNNEDDKSMVIEDYDMKNDDRYRVTKVLYENTATDPNIKISEIQIEVPAIVENNNSKQTTEYIVPISLIKAYEEGLSMGNGALNQEATIVEDENGYHITLSFKPLYIGNFGMTGHLTKLGYYASLEDMRNNVDPIIANIVSTYQDDNKTFPKKVTLTVPKLDNRIAVKVWVDAMDELAIQAGQKDGAQNAILLLDLENKKNVEVEENKKGKSTKQEELPKATEADVNEYLKNNNETDAIKEENKKGESTKQEELPEATEADVNEYLKNNLNNNGSVNKDNINKINIKEENETDNKTNSINKKSLAKTGLTTGTSYGVFALIGTLLLTLSYRKIRK